MEIGVGLPTNLRGTNKDLVLEWSRRAEAAGFASLCMGERLSYAGYDWLLALTAAASVTSRIRLLANVSVPVIEWASRLEALKVLMIFLRRLKEAAARAVDERLAQRGLG